MRRKSSMQFSLEEPSLSPPCVGDELAIRPVTQANASATCFEKGGGGHFSNNIQTLHFLSLLV